MVNNFKRVSAFSPPFFFVFVFVFVFVFFVLLFVSLLASSKDLTDVYLKTAKMIHLIFSRPSSRTACVDIMTRKENGGQVVIRVHMQRGTFFALRRLGRICFSYFDLRAS